MRQKKSPTVTLIAPKYDMAREFQVSHAERLLDMGVELNGGWELPKDSEYEYSEEYGLRLKSNKGQTAKAEKE